MLNIALERSLSDGVSRAAKMLCCWRGNFGTLHWWVLRRFEETTAYVKEHKVQV